MRKITMITALFCALFAAAPALAQEEAAGGGSEGIGLSVGMTYYSTYLWRGGYNYENEKSGCFYPSVSYDILGSGLTAGVSMELSDKYILEKDGRVNAPEGYVQQSLNAGLDYSLEVSMITLDLSGWYWGYYRSKDEGGVDTSSIGAVATVTVSALLSPFVSVSHDYYLDKENTYDGKSNSGNIYVQAGIGQSIELTKEVAVNLGLAGAYFNYKSGDQAGFSDIAASVGLEINGGAVSFANSFNYVFVPSGDFRDKTDKHKFFTEFGVTYSL